MKQFSQQLSSFKMEGMEDLSDEDTVSLDIFSAKYQEESTSEKAPIAMNPFPDLDQCCLCHEKAMTPSRPCGIMGLLQMTNIPKVSS